MKKLKLKPVLLFSYCFILCFGESRVFAQSDSGINVMTFNIRYENHMDGKYAWEFRKELVLKTIQKYDPDILGIQEALESQVLTLYINLNEYDWVGVGRDDGNFKGEFVPIFYKANKFELLQKGHFWLSETPEKPSKGWDGCCNRMVTFIKLKDKLHGNIFFVYNTHFDHQGKEAQKNSAQLLKEQIHKISGDTSSIILGDFNVIRKSKPYAMLTSFTKRGNLADTEYACQCEASGPDYTFIGFPFKENPGKKIDYIFINDDRKIRILNHMTITDNDEGYYPSDHLPVMVKLKIEK